MIEQLALNDALWRKISFSICKDKDQADEITQEMYLRFEKIKSTEPKYIFSILRHIFYDSLNKKEVLLDDFSTLESIYEDYIEPPLKEDTFRTKEEFQVYLEVFQWHEKTIYEYSNEIGQRKLSRETEIPLRTVHEINKKVKNKIKWQIVNQK
jgi:DNA-directed RNA polymerase specialized sigma24 family protein